MDQKSFKLPVLADSGLTRYLEEIKKFPMLEPEEEYMLAKSWQEHGDVDAAHKLVTSHLRLVAKIAMGYKGYGMPVVDLISEGNIGLMQAVKKFDPDAGVRLSTYAMWWVKAAIQEFVLRSWSLVKIGTTAVQKKLFFNLRKLKRRINAVHEGDLSPSEVKEIAKELAVPEHDVVDMDRRLHGNDFSLNQTLNYETGDEWGDFLADTKVTHDVEYAERDDYGKKKILLDNAFNELNEREQNILKERHLKEVPATLDELSKTYNISRERVRQIEARALEKLQNSVLKVKANSN